ncbi:MAG: ChbG/HpnK family deacetylase [Clostridia bacterium]|nr:ChbG/HpnK family deacetylase [Clostridia bacterium]
MKFIINADDFGISHNVNMAIVECFEKGYITNTTIMTNMPAFDEAVQLAHEHGFADKVGLHLNFVEGRPLSEAMKGDKYFCPDGQMISPMKSRKGIIYKFFLPRSTGAALEEETRAQIGKYLDAGFTQMHIDSHQHLHTLSSVWGYVGKTIKQSGFLTIRKTRNLFLKKLSAPVAFYKDIFNRVVGRDYITTEYFTSAHEYAQIADTGFESKANCEIMVHPKFQDGKLINIGSMDFEDLMQYLEDEEKISYSQLKG